MGSAAALAIIEIILLGTKLLERRAKGELTDWELAREWKVVSARVAAIEAKWNEDNG